MNIVNDYSNEKLMKAIDVAKRLNICRSLVYQLMQRGEIPTVRINSAVRVRPGDLEAYIQNCLTGWQDSQPQQ
jgi:excisionase family DNA binding protein